MRWPATSSIPQACREVVRTVIDRHGGIDILVNNAASTARGSLEDATLEFWDTMMAVNLRAPFLCLQEAVRSMKTRGGGSIVNIGSINAYVGLANLGPYSVSKGGLMTLTKNAAGALNRYRIRVNQLNVGWTLTEGEDRVQRADGKGAHWLDEAVSTRPFGRLLLPADVAIPGRLLRVRRQRTGYGGGPGAGTVPPWRTWRLGYGDWTRLSAGGWRGRVEKLVTLALQELH